MLCPPPSSSGPSNRKQVRFESPLISSYRKITLPSPPATPLLSPARSPQPPPLPPQILSRPRPPHHHRLVLSRSLPNSPQRKIGGGQQPAEPKQPGGGQKSLANRLLQAILLRPSRSTDSLLLATRNSQFPKCTPSNRSITTTNMPLSSSLTLISSPSPALCRIWEEERQRQDAMAKFQLAIRLQEQQFQADYARHFQSEEGGAISCWPPPSLQGRPQGQWKGRPALRRCPPGGGVNSCCWAQTAAGPLRKEQQEQEERRPAAYPNFCQLTRRSIPTSHSFPPPMAASSAPPCSAQQHAYNELEDFDDDFVPRSSTTARQNRLNSMDSQTGERVQIRRMSLKEFSGLDLLEEQSQQRAAAAAISSPHLHPWKSGGQLPALGSLIDKFSTRRRSSSSGGGLKLSTMENPHHHHNEASQQQQQQEECPYNSFDRVIEGISQTIRETTGGGDGQKEMEEQRKERSRRGSAQLEKQHSGTGRGSFGQTLQRLTNIRNHLNSTLQSVPNVSPRKAHAVDREKLLLLNECRILVAACKEMVRSANPSALGPSSCADSGQTADCLPLVQSAVDSAERMVESVEVLIRKSNSIFQAQQLTTNADQLLKALADTVKEVEKCQRAGSGGGHQQQKGGAIGGGGAALIRSSTTLAANLISFTEFIRGMG